MRIGFGAAVSGAWASPENLAGFAVRAEELGYASLWTFQRLLTPAEPEALAPVYRSVLDPLVALSYVASRTSRIRLGVAVVNLPFVTPAYLASRRPRWTCCPAGGSTWVSAPGGSARSSRPAG
jgi:alkanesulfonate monooxygenase SsuD/methylene tetrahydromethanopterin reductase-like flavin-dependent oxidoreductase (luciferase family)